MYYYFSQHYQFIESLTPIEFQNEVKNRIIHTKFIISNSLFSNKS